jgi:hypothetical protein
MPGRMDAAQASPVSAWMAVSREQNDQSGPLSAANYAPAIRSDSAAALALSQALAGTISGIAHSE